MKLLKIFLLIFVSVRELDAGVQFRHFPITDGRSESHDTSKSETRVIAKPTGRPSRPSDLNPLNLINEDNMFPQEKPKITGSLADEIKKQLSAHLKSSSGRQPIKKKKPDKVIRDPVVKPSRQPIKSKTVSTRPRFNFVNPKTTTEMPTVTTPVVSEQPLVEIRSHAKKIKPSKRVKIPVKKKRLVFRGRGRKIESGENIIKRVPVDITSLNRQNVLNTIEHVQPTVDLQGRIEPLSPIRIKPNLGRQLAVRVDTRKHENVRKSEIKAATIPLPSIRRKFPLSRQSAIIGDKRRQGNINKPDLETATIPLSPIRRNPPFSRQSTPFSNERKHEIISSKSVRIPLSPLRNKPTIARQSTVAGDKRKSGGAKIPLSQNRRQLILAKLAARITEKRKQERTNNFNIEPRRRDQIVMKKTVPEAIDDEKERSNGVLTARQTLSLQRSSLQDQIKELTEVRKQPEKRLNLPQKNQSKIKPNNFLPKLQSFFQPTKTTVQVSQFQKDIEAKFQQVKESNEQKLKHINSEQVKDAVTHQTFPSIPLKDASFQSIHPFNVKTTNPNIKQIQEIIPNPVDNQELLQVSLHLNQHNSRVLPVIPLSSQVRITPKGIDIKSQFKQINVQHKIPSNQPSLEQSEVKKPIIIPSQPEVTTTTIKNVITEAPRSSPETVTVSSQPTTQPTFITPTIGNTYQQDTTINEIEYTTQIPKRNIEFEETNTRQHPQDIKLDTDKILKIGKEEELSNEIFVYPTIELAMEHAAATWNRDPYRIKSKNAGKAMFDIDYSLDPEKYEVPYIEYDPTFAITTPITTQRPVSTTPYIQRQPSIKANPNLLQSSPSERSTQTIQLQLRRQHEQQIRREDPRLQRQQEQLVLKARQTHLPRKKVSQEQEEQQFPGQKVSKFPHPLSQRSRQEFQQHNTEKTSQPARQHFQEQERTLLQKSRQQLPQNRRQQLIQETRQQFSQKLNHVRQPLQRARQQIPKQQLPQKADRDFQQNTQPAEELRHNPENNFISGNIRFRNKARGPKSERKVLSIPAFDQYDYFEEDSGFQSDEEIEALKRALTFTIDWGR